MLFRSVNVAAGAKMMGLMFAAPERRFVLATDGGYGFVARLDTLTGKNKAGKAVLSLPKGCNVMAPVEVPEGDELWVASVSNEGRLLLFPLDQLPEMSKGKGNKMLDIPGPRAARREEFVCALTVLTANDALMIHAGKRKLTLKADDLAYYRGERGRRGSKLPRGFQKVDHLGVGE